MLSTSHLSLIKLIYVTLSVILALVIYDERCLNIKVKFANLAQDKSIQQFKKPKSLS